MRKIIMFSAAAAAVISAEAMPLNDNAIGGMKLRGYLGKRFDDMIANQLMKTDVAYLTDVFDIKHEPVGHWKTEFWGKYMHSAAPYAQYLGSEELKRRVEWSTARVIASQLADGYIGSYPEGSRSGAGWDVWGNKYTLLGLIHYCDFGGERRAEALAAAEKLCDYLIGQFGDGGRRIWESGCYRGLASGSVLEPVVWLYNRTKKAKYLEFAKKLAADLDMDEGPVLMKDAGKAPRSRPTGKPISSMSTHKSYEMMSCYQGLLELGLASGDRKYIDAAITAARKIAECEILITGGAGSDERWFDGAKNQADQRFVNLQETCVTTTWLRLCEKLLEITGDSFWADRFEQTFYNAYLAALKKDGSEFAAYTPLTGTRSEGHYHLDMQTDCCNANGPRGFLAFLRTWLMTGEKDTVAMNWYQFGNAKAKLASGTEVAFNVYTLYPTQYYTFPDYSDVRITNDTEGTKRFALKLRIPGWSAKTVVKVNGNEQKGVKAGEYFTLDREWKPGDFIEIWFDMSIKHHYCGENVAFTCGPVVLARDSRFRDGDFTASLLSAAMPESKSVYRMDFTANKVNPEFKGMWMEYAVYLPMFDHRERAESTNARIVKFCDYASAANEWTPMDFSAVWIPVQHKGW